MGIENLDMGLDEDLGELEELPEESLPAEFSDPMGLGLEEDIDEIPEITAEEIPTPPVDTSVSVETKEAEDFEIQRRVSKANEAFKSSFGGKFLRTAMGIVTGGISELVNSATEESPYEVSDSDMASLVGMGHTTQTGYRGAKQLLGFDIEEEATNELFMNQLYADEKFGTAATVGAIAGSVIEPTGIVAGVATGGLSTLVKAGTVTKALAVGAGTGTLSGAISYVDKEAGETWIGNTLTEVVLTGGLGAVVGGLQGKTIKKLFSKYEDEVASRVDSGMSISDAVDDVAKAEPDLVSQVKRADKDHGLIPDVQTATQNYKVNKIAEKGTMPLDTIKPSEVNAFRNGVDRLVGLVSTRVQNLSPEAFGKLRAHDAAVSYRPEKYRGVRSDFADYFVNKSGRKPKKKVVQFSADEARQFKKYVLNQNMEAAADFVESVRGPEALAAFNKARSVFTELGKEAMDMGVFNADSVVKNYWTRSISAAKRPEFLKAIGKEQPGVEAAWKTKLDALQTSAKKKYGRNMNDMEINNAFQAFVMKQAGDVHTVGLAMKRQSNTIKDEMLDFYDDPIEAMDSYIHRAVSEIEKAKFFGRDAYKSGTMGSEQGMFDVAQALDATATTKWFKGLELTDQAELKHLLNVRFNTGMQSANDAVKKYKGINNIALLGNFFSAATQVAELASSMYKNGLYHGTKAIFGKKGVTVEDLGLEQLFQEFEDVSTGGILEKVQAFTFKWSGFHAIDKLGKETFINSALSKATSAVKKSDSRAFKKFSNELRETMPSSDVNKLIADLKKYGESGKKEDITDDILAYTFSKLADVQPISRSELPELYLTSQYGKVGFTLKSFMMKQIDVLRQDSYNKIIMGKRKGDKKMMAEGGANLARYMLLLGGANLGVDKIKDLVSGKISMDDLEEEVQAATAGSLAIQIAKSSWKTYGLSEYAATKAEQEGTSGLGSTFLPPLPVINELVQIAAKGYNGKITSVDEAGEAVGKAARKMFRYIPFVGRFENHIFEEEKKKPQSSSSLFAEGGEVQPGANTMPLDEAMPEDGKPAPEPEETNPLYAHHQANAEAGIATNGGDTIVPAVVEMGEEFMLIPTLWDGEVLPHKEAAKRALESGIEWPTANSAEKLKKEITEVNKRIAEDDMPEPGVYEDEAGNLWRVTEDGKYEEVGANG